MAHAWTRPAAATRSLRQTLTPVAVGDAAQTEIAPMSPVDFNLLPATTPQRLRLSWCAATFAWDQRFGFCLRIAPTDLGRLLCGGDAVNRFSRLLRPPLTLVNGARHRQTARRFNAALTNGCLIYARLRSPHGILFCLPLL